jgi:hypothetical protein
LPNPSIYTQRHFHILQSSPVHLIFFHRTQPHLTNLPDLLTKHVSSIPLGNLACCLDHPASPIPQESHHLQSPHTPLFSLSTLYRHHLQQRLVNLNLHSRQSSPLTVRALGEIDQILLLGSQDALEHEVTLELANFVALVLCFGFCIISAIGFWFR